ncbi:MAG: reverse transcriptase family protein, partial [Pseudomonadota bacterium]
SIYSNQSTQSMPPSSFDTCTTSTDTLLVADLSLSDVLTIVKKLPSKSSVDLDGLSYNIIKKGGYPLWYRLYQLFSHSLKLCCIPSAWKLAAVTPIHKSGSKLEITNFRPISVTSCCSRILERIVNSKIVTYLNENRKLLNSQHGFCPGKSTDTILLEFYDYVTYNLDKNKLVDCVYFDYRKAFDTVPHDVLLSRIFDIGIRGNLLEWLSSFLTDRSQKVRISSSFSHRVCVSSGVIQGSVLGPTLFNIFINKIDSSLQYYKILKYADDIRIYLCSNKNASDVSDLHSKLQKDIDNLVQWSSNSGMSFNTNKCFSVSFGSSNFPRTYAICNTPIPLKNTFTDLGVKVSSPLSFKVKQRSKVKYKHIFQI